MKARERVEVSRQCFTFYCRSVIWIIDGKFSFVEEGKNFYCSTLESDLEIRQSNVWKTIRRLNIHQRFLMWLAENQSLAEFQVTFYDSTAGRSNNKNYTRLMSAIAWINFNCGSPFAIHKFESNCIKAINKYRKYSDIDFRFSMSPRFFFRRFKNAKTLSGSKGGRERKTKFPRSICNEN
jgi:hypothetical protein